MPRNLRLKSRIAGSGRYAFEVAESAGIRAPTLSEIVGGRLRPSKELKQRLAGALGCDAADLFPEAE